MSPDEFRKIISRFGWTQAEASNQLRIAARTARHYATGGPIPPAMALFLRFLEAVADKRGPKFALDQLKAAQQKMPPHVAGEKDDDEEHPLWDENGVPILGAGGPAPGMQPGQTWHDKEKYQAIAEADRKRKEEGEG